MIRLSLAGIPMLVTSGPGLPSIFKINGDVDPPARLIECDGQTEVVVIYQLNLLSYSGCCGKNGVKANCIGGKKKTGVPVLI